MAEEASGNLRRCLGPLAVTARAVATIGLTLTAVINIPEALRGAGKGLWISYAIAWGWCCWCAKCWFFSAVLRLGRTGSLAMWKPGLAAALPRWPAGA